MWVYAITNSNPPVVGNRGTDLNFTKLTTSNFEYYPTNFGGEMPLNVWQNICVIKDQTNFYYYRNASLIASATSSGTRPSKPFFIGGDPTASEYSNSRIAQAAVYNQALSAPEVQQNFTALRSRYGI